MRRQPGDRYWDGRYAQARREQEFKDGHFDDDYQLPGGDTFKGRLQHASFIVEQLGDAPLDEVTVDQVRELWETLDEIDRAVPTVELWCVVKHYRDHNPETGSWRPAVWTAHLSKEHAEQFAAAITAHYEKQGRLFGDRFLIERAQARITQVMDPRRDAVEYIRRLGI